MNKSTEIKKGDTVKLSEKFFATNNYSKSGTEKRKALRGVVMKTGLINTGTNRPDSIKVKWNGKNTTNNYHKDYLTII